MLVAVEEAHIHCSKHVPLLQKLRKDIHWGTDNKPDKGGDAFKAKTCPRPWDRADRQQLLELYTRIESMVNEELPLLYLHHVTALQAGVRHLKGYQPALSGLFSTRGGGVRTAWLA
jgi:hypothetical protein